MVKNFESLLSLTAILLLASALLALAGCGSCPGPPAEVAPATVEEPAPAAEVPAAEVSEVDEPADAGPSDPVEEEDTAMASEGEGG